MRYREYYAAKRKQYCLENKEKIQAATKKRWDSSPDRRILCAIRRRTREFMKLGGMRYGELVGCTHEFLRGWFEFNFEQDYGNDSG